MKYNTISTSSLASEGKKSTLTIYADMDISHKTYPEAEMTSIRGELEIVQKALKLQTKRCRQLVAEYTRRLQEKELQYHSEKALRDNQLAKVLRALLIFEARLKQEQKFISHQLNEKDYIIKKQSNDIKKLLQNHYCKSCNQYYISSPIQESLDSSSEYVITDCQDYLSSNFESLESSSENYGTMSEKGYNKSENIYESYTNEENSKSETESLKMYQKNENKDSLGRRSRKTPHRKNIGTYFEVLKLRNDSPISNEDNTSNDYDNLDSLPPESVADKIGAISQNIEHIFDQNDEIINETESSPNVSISDCTNTVIGKAHEEEASNSEVHADGGIRPEETRIVSSAEEIEVKETKTAMITETIPVFDADEEEINENWYASASDQEDEEQRDIYRNNPVLECMNQILLQNINDSLNSPPKTPNIDRKAPKNKRVKFSDEESHAQEVTKAALTEENLKETHTDSSHDYYETPIQKTPNFYETPQSIYSNDYEQILSKCSETFSSTSPAKPTPEKDQSKSPKKIVSHYYIDIDNNPESTENNDKIVRKNKILRTPPALPPKPANLISRYKTQSITKNYTTGKTDDSIMEHEPDYCSISELNLPQVKNASFKKINVVAEINAPTSKDVMSKLNPTKERVNQKLTEYDPINLNDKLIVKKCVEKFNIQLAKQTPIKSDAVLVKKIEPEIPKLPQVSEIIIPDETEDEDEGRITQDNYVKNNSQILKLKTNTRSEVNRRSIVIGSSVSSLITGFNNQQLLSEIKKKSHCNKPGKQLFSSFENLQNIDKHMTSVKDKSPETSFNSQFDLSQNFEEFKLDDCEIEEYTVEEDIRSHKSDSEQCNQTDIKSEIASPPKEHSTAKVELIRATNDIMTPTLNRNSIELVKKQLELQKGQIQSHHEKESSRFRGNEPTYEHFLECTGLSTKSILTPSRLLSNHKSMLKPKDVKLRSKVRSNNLFERHSTSSIKYWSEPYI